MLQEGDRLRARFRTEKRSRCRCGRHDGQCYPPARAPSTPKALTARPVRFDAFLLDYLRKFGSGDVCQSLFLTLAATRLTGTPWSSAAWTTSPTVPLISR